MPQTETLSDGPPLTLQLAPVVHLSLDQLYQLCRINRDLRIERTAAGELVIMPPTGGATGSRNARFLMQLAHWAEQDGSGVAFDSSTAFVLPNGAVRSPDASWVRRDRLTRLSDEEKEKFLPLCPDFVVELRSPSDSSSLVEAKMHEYQDNGARLGFLLDAVEKRVHVFRKGRAVRVLEAPASVPGEPVLPGFRLDLEAIWSPGW